jgi:predicted ATPase/serine phosphatase RsbU (regulator of sigma subunit)/tRNA A-37 threonylcarbamoyl transferase component Bud32
LSNAVAGYTLTDIVRETPSTILLRGTRDADGARVIVKMLRAEHPTAAQIARLRHEHAVLSSLDLPEVVRPLALVKHGRGVALVLEDLGAVSLESKFRHVRPSPAEFLDLAIRMAGALAAIHRRAVIHKDIKPHHFLLCGDEIKLIDFGIATRLTSETQVAKSASLLDGTLAYMSPEQTGRMSRTLDRRTDLYSLGASFYQLLTGHLPFEASDPLELVHAHIARAPRPVVELRPDAPRPISDIVLKLMAKAAEDRYQSASGLKVDLEACLAELRSTGQIGVFPLARHDASGELTIPQKLYGREAEVATLLAAFERARRGGSGLLLVAGPAGSGKSALVSEIQGQVAQGGAFAAGRFAELNRSIPFAGLAAACRSLVRSLLVESSAAMDDWARRLREAVGRNGRLVTELVPELEMVIGPQPAVAPTGPAESQARFELTFRQFLQVFARSEHPLVLFLDDLQWADAASLRLVRQLVPSSSHLLVIGAYRDGDAALAQPLRSAAEELRKTGVPIEEVTLGPLGLDHVVALLGDTLRLDAAATRPLAEVLLRKTDGNPFFLHQFLSALGDQRLLAFDRERGRWTWDDAKIEAAVASDNVVDLLVARLRRLSDVAREVLTLGACIGQEWDLDTLSVIARSPRAELVAGIWEGLREGVLVPLDASSRLVAENAKVGDELGDGPVSSYRVLHERVLQAAYALLDAGARAEVHARVGRHLLAKAGETPSDETLFEIVRQLNLGAAAITGADERRELATLNLSAGMKVAGSGAHAAAIDLIRRGLALLGPNGPHDALHQAHLTLASSEFLNGNLPGALQLLDTIEAEAQTTLERVDGRKVRIDIYTSVNRLLDAVACGLETARMLGAQLPADDTQLDAAIGAEIGAVKGLLAGRSIESFLDLPEMTDLEKRALVEVYFKTNSPAFMAKPPVSVLFGLKAVRLAIEHGNAPKSPYFYGNYGIINSAIGGELDVSYRSARLGIDLIQKTGWTEIEGSTYFLFGAFNCHWRRPLAESLDALDHAVKACLETGAYLHLAWAAVIHLYYRFFRGEPLEEVLAGVPRTAELLRRAESAPALTLLKVLEQTVKAYAGMTGAPTSLDGDGYDEAAFQQATKGIRVFHVYHHILKQALVFYAGDYKQSLEIAEAALPLMPGMYFITEHALYRTLAKTILLAEETAEAAGAQIEALRVEEAQFRTWAEASPENHAHRHALVAAEIAALAGDHNRAIDLYDQAIKLARESGFAQHEALANELAARFHLRRQRVQVARAYAREAWYGYQQWGAKHKLRQLVERHGNLQIVEVGPGPISATTAPDSVTGTSTTTDSSRLDLLTAVRATQALAGELELGKLLERLMRTLVENAGAQKGVLLMNHDGALEVEALVTTDPHRIQLGLRQPLEQSTELATSVVQYVGRSKEAVVLGNASGDSRFARDPYVVSRRPKSLLCLAMQHQGRLVGVLYLENNAATNAFSPERVEILQLVAAQAAVAVENAKLYGELRAATAELRRSNDTLEAQVAQRTQELERTLADLWSEMDLARKIQTVLLPRETRFSDYEVSAVMVPAATVGGDYYDIIRTEGSDWVLIGDVSGHGVTAGLSMMMVQTAIRTVVLGANGSASTLTPSQVLAKANAAVRGNMHKVNEDHYMTITGLQLQGGSIRYAGLHQDILIYRASSGTVERVETRGMWIGPVDDIGPLLRDETLELRTGDVVLLFTDGITEAMVGGRRFGTDGLVAAFARLAANGQTSEAILEGIMRNVEGTAQEDDVTMMAVRYMPREAA